MRITMKQEPVFAIEVTTHELRFLQALLTNRTRRDDAALGYPDFPSSPMFEVMCSAVSRIPPEG